MSRRFLTIAAIAIANSSASVRSSHTVRSTALLREERGVFVVVRGTDTLAIESFERGANFLAGDVKAPGRPWFRYRVDFDTVNRPKSLSLSAYSAGRSDDTSPLQRVDAVVAGDSLVLQVSGAAGTTTQRVLIGRDAWLIVGQSTAELEDLLRLARRAGSDSVVVSAYAVLGGRTTKLGVRFFGADSAALTQGVRSMVHFDRQGRMTRVVQGDGQVVVTRSTESAVRTHEATPSYTAPPDAPYRAEQVRVQTPSDVVLAGTLTLPPSASRARVPAVITISGSGPQDRDSYLPFGAGYRPFRQIADTLSRRGIAVLRLDDRGTGSSTGSFATATEVDFAADVRAAIAFLRTRPDIDPNRIALLGHSEGGIIAPLAAAEDARIAAIVLMAGPADPKAAVIEQNRRSIAAEKSLSAAQRDSVWRRVRPMLDSAAKTDSWFGGFLRYDGRATAARIKMPVLILQGATDSQVPREQAELYARFFRDSGNKRVTTVLFPDRNHLFLRDPDGSLAGYSRLPSMTIDQEVLGRLADWLAGNLSTGMVNQTGR